MNALLLAFPLSMTLPSYDRPAAARDTSGYLGPVPCAADSARPCHDLSRLRVWGAPQYEPVRIIAEFDVSGMEGQRIQVWMNDQGKVWTVWVTTLDDSGNESCRSNQIGVNLGPGIPDPTHPGPEYGP